MRGAASEEALPPPPFTGFGPAAFGFLRDLADRLHLARLRVVL